MTKIHIEKGSVQETLIIPLYGRKLCAEQFPTLYQDAYAAKVICRAIIRLMIRISKAYTASLQSFATALQRCISIEWNSRRDGRVKLKAGAEPMAYWPPVFRQGKGYK